MSASQRQAQFEQTVKERANLPNNAVLRKSFGLSNCARVAEDGLYAGCYNLEGHSKDLAAGNLADVPYALISMIALPPSHEVYFAAIFSESAPLLDKGLRALHYEGEQKNSALVSAQKRPGKINNNVHFYVTRSGTFRSSNDQLTDSIENADQSGFFKTPPVTPDSVYFAVWPPTGGVASNDIVSEFIGYLGVLIGRDKLHEVRVWEGEHSLGPEMRRMPSELDVNEIKAGVSSLGGYYPHQEIERLHAGLNYSDTKHFVILTGLSGTGKTQLALKYARSVHGIDDNKRDDPLLFVCPVRPEWTDPTGLTGYYDVLSDRYVVPTFLEAVLTAKANNQSPVFVVLDELNLARVEYYLSDVLSAIESGEKIQLHSSDVPLDGSNGSKIGRRIAVPSNLFIIGTINIDETTAPISDKVLDRAQLIDVSTVDMDGFLKQLGASDTSLLPAVNEIGSLLANCNKAMTDGGLGFGYRVAEEAIRYATFASDKLGAAPAKTTDDLLVQKVLCKLRGTERQRPMLENLLQLTAPFGKAKALLERLVADLNEFGSFQASR